MLDHKTSFNKFKKIEIISSIFYNHNGMKLEINSRKKTGKNTNTWRLNNMLLNNQWVNEEIKEKQNKTKQNKKNLETKMETQRSKIYGTLENISKMEVCSDTGLPQETSKISNR